MRRRFRPTRLLIRFALAVDVIMGPAAAHAQVPGQPSPSCPTIAGMIGGPLVATPDAAHGIYIAVARSRGDPIHHANRIVVDDEGDHWSVFQFPVRRPTVRPGEVVVTSGGGTLDLQINKCDGSLLAHYAR
jgi:hypothetical protein